MRRTLGSILVLVALLGSLSGATVADPPPLPTDSGNGLSDNETATLWSKTPDDCEAGDDQTAMQTLGRCTDATFKTPPDTAARWTSNDFMSLRPGDSETSVYPEHATRSDSKFVRDAHATIFSIQPSTVVHRDAESTPQYVAPKGQLQALIDYRVAVPTDKIEENRTIEWSLAEDSVTQVRLYQDDDRISRAYFQQTPVLNYQLDGAGNTTVRVEADIEVELEQEITHQLNNESWTEYQYTTETVTVTDELDVEVYDLSAEVYHAEYPDGNAGVAIYQSQPWHGYELTDDGEASVRGNWRYYTARDTDWDHLVHASRDDEETTNSDARPVYVHAFPSEVGPRVEPVRDGPEIQEVWGYDSESPAPTLHENVEIGIVDEPYTRSYGLAVQYDDLDRDTISVQGIVNGETATITEPAGRQEREVRASELMAEVIEETDSGLTVRLELRDATTGEPIVLEHPYEDHPRLSPIGADRRDGYISIGDQYVRTDENGTAMVELTEPGGYTAQYHPGSWRTHEPAFVADRASVGGHPLTTAGGWLSLFIHLFWLSIPFLVALYAGLKLGSFLNTPEDHYP